MHKKQVSICWHSWNKGHQKGNLVELIGKKVEVEKIQIQNMKNVPLIKLLIYIFFIYDLLAEMMSQWNSGNSDTDVRMEDGTRGILNKRGT